jgi:RIP metalloprotease RseP
MSEIKKSIEDNPGKDIQVTVLRDGQEKLVTVRPKARATFGRTVEPLLTVHFWVQETGAPIVADTVTEVTPELKTPAAVLKDVMPRGSRLTRVDDQPVASWTDVTRKFISLAGKDVKVSWVYEGTPEQSVVIHVPQTIETALDLPLANAITSINGKSRVEVEVNGRRDSYDVNSAVGQRAVLKELLDQGATEAEVTYQLLLEPGEKTQKVALAPEMLDLWTKRIAPTGIDVIARPKVTLVQHRNPIKAMMVGIWKTYYFVEHVYLMAQRMLITRSVSMDQVSGPVGIFKLGGDFADLGITYLLYFLALISANLAVINFLPLPIVDGGLFVFLLIEKIKGKPISLRVQVATQVIGLALIVSIFAWVTFQDILKLW